MGIITEYYDGQIISQRNIQAVKSIKATLNNEEQHKIEMPMARPETQNTMSESNHPETSSSSPLEEELGYSLEEKIDQDFEGDEDLFATPV